MRISWMTHPGFQGYYKVSLKSGKCSRSSLAVNCNSPVVINDFFENRPSAFELKVLICSPFFQTYSSNIVEAVDPTAKQYQLRKARCKNSLLSTRESVRCDCHIGHLVATAPNLMMRPESPAESLASALGRCHCAPYTLYKMDAVDGV